MATNDTSLKFTRMIWTPGQQPIIESWSRSKKIVRHSFKRMIHRCISIFYLLPFHTWGTSKVQLLDATVNFLKYFKWVNADEEFSTCINIISWSMRCHWSWLDVGRRVGTQTKTIEELLYSPSLVGGYQAASVSYMRHATAVNFWHILND